MVAPAPLPTIKPVELFTVIGTGTDPPTVTGKVTAVDVREKLSVVAVTVRLTCAVVAEELVGVMVIVVGPDGAMLGRVAIVNVTGGALDVPVNVTLAGLKLQVAPVGRPVQLLGLKFTTMAVEPAIGAIVSVDVADCPAETGVGVRVLAVSAKSGASVAFQATARLLPSTEPRPPTGLYPVVASELELELSNPNTPPPGHITSLGSPEGVPTWQ